MPRTRTDVQFCEKCDTYTRFEDDKDVVAVGKNDGMICAVWEGLACKVCGFKTVGNIYRKGHPYFDSLMLEIGEKE